MALNAIQSGIGVIDPKSWKEAVNVASTVADGVLPLTGFSTVDGVVTTAGMRVLVKDQNPGGEHIANGIYNAAAGAWTRAVDASLNQQFEVGLVVTVTDGAENALRQYMCNEFSVQPIVLGTTAIGFSRCGINIDDQADWTQIDTFAASYIRNKPTLAAPLTITSVVNTAGTYNAAFNELVRVDVRTVAPGIVTVQLPVIDLASAGVPITIKNVSSDNSVGIAIQAGVANFIDYDDGAPVTLYPYKSIFGAQTYVSDGGTRWVRIASY